MHLHDLFDARLFSIHPDTHRIRAFVPYDVVTEFHGRKAFLPPVVDREALRHHWDMCCIENMAALAPYPDIMPLDTSGVATSGTGTPFSARTDLPITPKPGDDVSTGDPSKKSRPAPRPQDQDLAPGQNDTGEACVDEGCNGKRRRLHDGCHDFVHAELFDSHVTAWNSRRFLADVNWELQKFKASELL
ncbi:hypothetical protein ACHAPT_012638 [Fusarium lateritium]